VKRTTLTTLVLACLLVLNSAVAAEGAGEKADLAELAKQEQNPLARLIRVQLEDNAQFGFGPDNEVLNFLRIQPVIPFDLSEDCPMAGLWPARPASQRIGKRIASTGGLYRSAAAWRRSSPSARNG